jgi:hypothetical protein
VGLVHLTDARTAAAARARATAFLESVQRPSGELPVFVSLDPEMRRPCTIDPSIFPTAIAAHALSFAPEASAVAGKALDFLAAEMQAHGLWKHWPRAHPHAATLPADADDTSCASAALLAAGRPVPDNSALLLGNRDSQGRFFTWFLPRPRRRLLKATWPLLLRLPMLAMFFRRTSARPGDVDAVVNANIVFRLGDFPGREKVIGWLLDILRQGSERSCDKWYENPFVVRYFFSRVLSDRADGRALLVARTAAETPATMLDHALAAVTLSACGADAAPHLRALIDGQSEDGSWPRAAFYHGGRARLPGGGFAPPHPDTPHWGSEALTTAIAMEALARASACDPD